MKIGMLLDDPFPPDARVENEVALLIEAGHDVFLLAIGSSSPSLSKGAVHKELSVTYRPHRTRLHRQLSALAYSLPFYHLTQLNAIKAFIRSNAIEALHVHDLKIARAAFWANKTFQLPLVLDLHENRPEIMRFYQHVQTFPGRFMIFPSIWRRFESRYILKSTQTIVVTKDARDFYEKRVNGLSENTITVVPNSVNAAFLSKAKQVTFPDINQKINILYIGDTGARRGIKTILDSIFYLPDSIRDRIQFQIVGTSSAQPEWEAYVLRHQLESQIKLVGWKTISELHHFLGTSHIGICPLHRNTHHDTTYANKIFQYMAYGLPLVVSDCDAQANLAQKNNTGLVHQAQSAEDFAKKITSIATNPTLFLELSNNGMRAMKNELNWNAISHDLRSMYDALARQHSKSP
mgnify:FL=1|tara:strand:+ start:1327 stop:2544 length:1218 start_codon:yes stop_codon:yes gene_type:complete